MVKNKNCILRLSRYKNALLAKMTGLGIREDDLIEKFVRSSGPGGQNVNKTSTCVFLRHLPTGIEVKCQRERAQAENRYLAREILCQKIENLILSQAQTEKARAEKIRRQQRKRSRKAKLKILEAKRRQAQKKILRSKVRQIE